MPEEQGIGESPAEQTPPVSTVAREKLRFILESNKKIQKDCEEMLAILEAKPDLDASFCRLFGITKPPVV